MSRGRYQTKQQMAIESFMHEHEGESYTVDMLCSQLAQEGISIGKATVYRSLERMVNDGVLIAVPDVQLGCVRYSCTDSPSASMYLMCDSCHKIKPLECEAIGNFINHVADEHDFIPDSQKTIMYGKCSECGSDE